jgi:hypothetical protein
MTVALVVLAACELEPPRTPDRAANEAYGVASSPIDAPAPGAAAEPRDDRPEPPWPRRFTSGDTSFATYEPQVDSWKDDSLHARVAVEALPRGATTPTYGVVWFEARTRTDEARGLVQVDDVRLVRAHFPTAKEREAEYLEALRGADVVEAKSVSVARLQAQLAYGANHGSSTAQPVSNEAPTILVSERPEMVVLVDGPPRWRPEPEGVSRAQNTRALLLSQQGSTYVWVGDRWFRSTSVDGTYAEARDVPPAIDTVKTRFESAPTVDLYTDATERVRKGMTVVVATNPTELVETRGAPVYEPIAGTKLAWLSNTDSDVLRETTTGTTYVLLSGRWFRAASLAGPWTFVPGRDLPVTFRDIPKDHREARVLASVPGTPEADEAAIVASIPRTATVDRGQVRLAVAYDGNPDFEPVEGTSAPLKYAVNSATPVVQASDGMYYAVENGVWFVSASPDGPWTVATSVPDVVYSIPVSSPIHYVTYVRIYGYSPDYAFVGYTPGYVGALYTDGGLVWGFGPTVIVAGRGHPWWGPARFWRPGWGWRGPVIVARSSVYERWSPSVVRAAPAHASYAPRAVATPAVGVGGRTLATPRTVAPPSVGARAVAPPAVTPRASPAPFTATPRAVAPPAVLAPRMATPPSGTFRSAPPMVGHPSIQAPSSGGFRGGPGRAPPAVRGGGRR